MHDQIVDRANVYGYGQINPIVDDIFGLPAPGWEYTERFGYHPNVPEGTELLLEPGDHPAVPRYKKAIVAEGIPAHSFQVQDLQANGSG